MNIQPLPSEVPRPETLSSQEVFDILKGFEGREIAPYATWSIGRRAGKNVDKGISTSVDGGVYKTFAPGAEHAGYSKDTFVLLTAKSLLTLSRHALRPELGTTISSKSESYTTNQEELAQLFGEITGRDIALEAADVAEGSEELEDHRTALSELHEAFVEFAFGSVRDLMSDEDDTAADQAFWNVFQIVRKLQSGTKEGL